MREFTEEHRKKIGQARKNWLAKHPKEKEAIIEYVSHDSYIVRYICTVCNCTWINRN